MNSIDSLIERLQQVIAIGQNSLELRLPPVPVDWRIDVTVDSQATLSLGQEGDRFVFRPVDEAGGSAVRIELSAATLAAILDDKMTPTRAWTEGSLTIRGLRVAHFTDPSLSVLFQLLRCGVGRRLPPRRQGKDE